MKTYIKGNVITCGEQDVKVSKQEAMIAALLIGGEVVSREAMIEELYPNPDNEPDWADGRVSVLICKLKKKIKKLGLTVYGLYGQGYMMAEIKK